MDNFWKYVNELPSGSGYTHFSIAHLLCMAAFLAAMNLDIRHFDKMDSDGRARMLKRLPVEALILETIRDIIIAGKGFFNVGVLPLHLCPQAIFVYLYREYAANDRQRSALGEIGFALMMPGAIGAVIFPDWTAYPVFNYFNLNGYVTHFIFVLYPILIERDGQLNLSVRHLWYEVLYLVCTGFPMYAFNCHFHTNFMFLNDPVPPLDLIEKYFGQAGYLIGFAIVVLIFILIMYGLEHAFRSRWKKNNRGISA